MLYSSKHAQGKTKNIHMVVYELVVLKPETYQTFVPSNQWKVADRQFLITFY